MYGLCCSSIGNTIVIVEKSKDAKSGKQGIGYRLLKLYLRFIHNHLYYRRVYWLGRENIPEKCPLLIVSDHQNGLADPLGILMSVRSRKNRKIRLIARADVFKPALKRIMDWVGVLPAFRLSFDGEESLINNADTFGIAEEELLNDGTVVIYPEAGHQDKRWLGKFSHGYLRIIFEAAEKSNFEKEIFILPSCNHYSDYFKLREEMLIKYGNPISAKPYYELYKTKPRTAQRQLNAVVWQQVSELMLNITDLDNYDAVDYLRNTYGIRYAKAKGLSPSKLPEKLLADKLLFAELDEQKAANGEEVNAIYRNIRMLERETKQQKIADRDFDRKSNLTVLFLEGLLLLALLPLFIFACIPNILTLHIPKLLTSKIEDKWQHSGINFALNALATIPISYIIAFLTMLFITESALISLTYFVNLPFLGIFAWHYGKYFKNWTGKLRFRKLWKNGKLNSLATLRLNTYKRLDTLLNVETKR